MTAGTAFRLSQRPGAGHAVTGVLRCGVSLADYTSWRVGGVAARFYQPRDAEDLAQFLAHLPQGEPVLWIGLGSNLLVRDGGWPGTVVCTKGSLKRIERLNDHAVYAECGAATAQVARFSAEQGLVGAEFMAGIPGTLGGALAMNAGAFGGETWPIVSRVRVLDRRGLSHWRNPADFEIGYRRVVGLGPGECFLAAELALQPGDSAAARHRIRELLARRAATQPTNLPSCGSTFRNPPGDHAGRLIEQAGLKGYRLGGAEVSEKHANFIVNSGEATAADIEQLIRHVQHEVFRQFGVRLETEVRIVGDACHSQESRRAR